jgi:hypothetical protein
MSLRRENSFALQICRNGAFGGDVTGTDILSQRHFYALQHAAVVQN